MVPRDRDPGPAPACSGMLARELESRERSKRARLLRQARFPVPKAVEGFDWSNVRFPDGWGRDDMLSLDFVGRAEDLVFHGPTGRGKTHVATALGIGGRPGAGCPCASSRRPRWCSSSGRRSATDRSTG